MSSSNVIDRSALIAIAGLWILTATGASAADGAECSDSSSLESAQKAHPESDELRERLMAFEEARAAIERGSSDAETKISRARRLLPDPEKSSEIDIRVRIHFARTLALEANRVRVSEELATNRAAVLDLEASNLFARTADQAETLGLHRLRSFALGYRAEIYAIARRFSDALRLNELALLAAYAVSDPEALALWHSQRGRLLRALDKPEEARGAYEFASDALERLRLTMDVGKFLEIARPALLPLSDLLLSESESKEPAEREVLLRSAQRAIEGLKGAVLRDFFGDPCLADQTRTEASSVAGALVLYPVVLEDRVELLVGHTGRLHRVRSPVPSGELIAEARRFRLRLQDPTTRRYRISAERLYDGLIRPIESFIDQEGVETLVVVPSEELFRIPLGALRDRDTGRFLVERIPVAVTPSLELTEPKAIRRSHVRTLVAGLTTSVEGFGALPNVNREIDSVLEAFPGVSIEGDQFTLERFEATFDSRPFGIVHIASHGSFAGRSEESFLVTRDGRLPIDRLAEIIGRARFRGEAPLELLTLSACESAVGDDRALLGLAGIAVRSGARSALATLWRVDDAATAELVGAFYRELARVGTSRAQALQRAQLTLLENKRFRHPDNWAPFILIGSWL